MATSSGSPSRRAGCIAQLASARGVRPAKPDPVISVFTNPAATVFDCEPYPPPYVARRERAIAATPAFAAAIASMTGQTIAGPRHWSFNHDRDPPPLFFNRGARTFARRRTQ